MSKKLSYWIEDRMINASELALWAYMIVVGSAIVLGTLVAVLTQALEWLEHGDFPSRDGFWLYTLVVCDGGWCRPESLAPTDWVGVNKIINWIMDIHVVVYAYLAGSFAYGIAISWADSIGDWKAREERIRRAPAPPDLD